MTPVRHERTGCWCLVIGILDHSHFATDALQATGTWTMGKNVVRVDDGELLIIRSMARSELRARRCRQRFRPYAVIIPERSVPSYGPAFAVALAYPPQSLDQLGRGQRAG